MSSIQAATAKIFLALQKGRWCHAPEDVGKAACTFSNYICSL